MSFAGPPPDPTRPPIQEMRLLGVSFGCALLLLAAIALAIAIFGSRAIRETPEEEEAVGVAEP